eukprot:5675875-Pleurochrysis_carterae.AAC.1
MAAPSAQPQKMLLVLWRCPMTTIVNRGAESPYLNNQSCRISGGPIGKALPENENRAARRNARSTVDAAIAFKSAAIPIHPNQHDEQSNVPGPRSEAQCQPKRLQNG